MTKSREAILMNEIYEWVYPLFVNVGLNCSDIPAKNLERIKKRLIAGRDEFANEGNLLFPRLMDAFIDGLNRDTEKHTGPIEPLH